MKSSETQPRMELKLFASYHQDGILDLLVGMSTILFGIVALSDQSSYLAFLILIALAYLPLKQVYTIPRMGFVEFTQVGQKRRRGSLQIVGGIAFLLGILVYYALAGNIQDGLLDFVANNLIYVLGLIAGLILGSIGFFLNLPRFYFYGVVTMASIWGTGLLSIDSGYGVLAAGLFIILVGISTMVRFLSNSPAQR